MSGSHVSAVVVETTHSKPKLHIVVMQQGPNLTIYKLNRPMLDESGMVHFGHNGRRVTSSTCGLFFREDDPSINPTLKAFAERIYSADGIRKGSAVVTVSSFEVRISKGPLKMDVISILAETLEESLNNIEVDIRT